MRKALFFVAASAVLTAPAVAQSSADPEIVVEAVKEKKVCQRVIVTGSNMPKRVCRSASEQAAMDKANARRTSDYVNDKNSRGGLAAGATNGN